MIYSGFSGIGKTSVAKRNNKYIDLESSLFRINSVHIPGWEVIYCNIVEYLSVQGFDLFISAHMQVRAELHKRNISFVAITPTLSLKEQWIVRLKERYGKDPTFSNGLALKSAEEYYDIMVNSLINEPNKIILDSIDYDLEEVIKNHNNM